MNKMPNKFTDITFKQRDGKEILLAFTSGVFIPNTTSELLIKAAKKNISSPSKILDLGCGTGVVGLSIWLSGRANEPVYGSDLSTSAVECSKENFKRNNCGSDIRCGSLFEPWANETFDVIIDDISGISQEVASISPWFEGVPCDTGPDGAGLISEILYNASKYLSKDGSLFFPVLSLSNVDQILKCAKDNFSKVELIDRIEWPLPDRLKKHTSLLRNLDRNGNIKLIERFGMVLCYTEIYIASCPINNL